MAPGGELRGFVARGNVVIDLKWADGKVLLAAVDFRTLHFWHSLRPRTGADGRPDMGFYAAVDTGSAISVSVASPNELQGQSVCASVTPAELSEFSGRDGTVSSLSLRISSESLPCIVVLCAQSVADCQQAYRDFVAEGIAKGGVRHNQLESN